MNRLAVHGVAAKQFIGTFAGKWIAENKNGRTFFNSKRAQLKKHQMELVGDELRRNMIWGGDKDLDTASN